MRVINRIILLLISLFYLTQIAVAQSEIVSLTGIVVDETEARIVGANVSLFNPETGFYREMKTNVEGVFSYQIIPVGSYRVTITHPGFAGAEIQKLPLDSSRRLSLLVRMKVGGISEAIIIYAKPGTPDDPGLSTLLDRKLVERLPAQGHDFQTLISVAPGLSFATSTNGIVPGQYSFNGQRPSSNYFMIDGVSANIDAGTQGNYQKSFTGALPGVSLIGGFSNLVSMEALQEINIITSPFAPEFGRTPGGLISVETRSGTSELHGKLFQYFRDSALNSDDWFHKGGGDKNKDFHQNLFGGVIGGPVHIPKLISDKKTLFFLSYEGLRLRQPKKTEGNVPSMEYRSSAPESFKPILNAFPVPNKTYQYPVSEPPYTGRFEHVYAIPSNMDTVSLRVDRNLKDRLIVFGRHNESFATTRTRHLSSVERSETNTQTTTLGLTFLLPGNMTNDLRINYSQINKIRVASLDDIGGAIPPQYEYLFPDNSSNENTKNYLQFMILDKSIPPYSFYYGGNLNAGNDVGFLQRQFNIINNFAKSTENHQLKFGIDYRRLSPRYLPIENNRYLEVGTWHIDSGKTNISFRSSYAAKPLFKNFSFYTQDIWRTKRNLTLTYGLRWDLNPTPTIYDGILPLGVIEFTNRDEFNKFIIPDELKNIPPPRTVYNNIAPRIGFSYRIPNNNSEFIIRGGIGLFYDLGASYTSYGVNTSNIIASAYSLSSGSEIRNRKPTDPKINVSEIDTKFRQPSTLRWSLGVERSIGIEQSISASYVGTQGRKLPNLAVLPDPIAKYPDYGVVKNEGKSDYHALQLQYQRRFATRLSMFANYTWSHSIDLGSDDLKMDLDKASSDFDIRHVFSGVVNYDLPTPDFDNKNIGKYFSDWSLDSIIRFHSAIPVNVLNDSSRIIYMKTDGSVGSGNIRPDIVPGVPLYKKADYYPGGKRINPEAFSYIPIVNGIPSRQGTLGRNALRGFGFKQVDISLHKQFKFYKNTNILFKADIFNFFNFANFSPPYSELNSGSQANYNFGVSQSVIGGLSSSINNLSTLNQLGGARIMQLSLKLQF